MFDEFIRQHDRCLSSQGVGDDVIGDTLTA